MTLNRREFKYEDQETTIYQVQKIYIPSKFLCQLMYVTMYVIVCTLYMHQVFYILLVLKYIFVLLFKFLPQSYQFALSISPCLTAYRVGFFLYHSDCPTLSSYLLPSVCPSLFFNLSDYPQVVGHSIEGRIQVLDVFRLLLVDIGPNECGHGHVNHCQMNIQEHRQLASW